MHFSKRKDIPKLEGQKPKINSKVESTLQPARIQKPPHGALYILPLSASLLASYPE